MRESIKVYAGIGTAYFVIIGGALFTTLHTSLFNFFNHFAY